MTRPKVFASDFDGTLNFHDGTPVRDADRSAIEAFQAAGGRFGICTGRSLGALLTESDGFVTPDFVIADTGAAIYDHTGKLIFECTLSPDVAERLWATFYARSTWGGVISAAGAYYSVGGTPSAWVHVVDTFADVPLPIHGVSFGTHTVEESTAMACEVNRAFAGEAIAHQNLNSIDVVPVDCSKGTGVAHVRALLDAGIVAGMGDSFNDLPLLQAADVAYTFPDAAPELCAAADVLVGSVAEALADFMAASRTIRRRRP